MLDKIKYLLQHNTTQLLGQEEMNKFAVLIPLIKQPDNTLSVLFEVRAKGLRRQPGEISFPGGKIEAEDFNAAEAAKRETSEELGIDENQIDIIHQLGIFVPSRHTIIYPFVANIKTNQFNPNPDEVENIFLVPLDFFLQTDPGQHKVKLRVEPDESFPFHLIPGGENYPWRYRHIIEFFYRYNDYVIWGMTAHILYYFVSILKHDWLEQNT